MGPRGLKVGKGWVFFPGQEGLILEGKVSWVKDQVSGVRCWGVWG